MIGPRRSLCCHGCRQSFEPAVPSGAMHLGTSGGEKGKVMIRWTRWMLMIGALAGAAGCSDETVDVDVPRDASGEASREAAVEAGPERGDDAGEAAVEAGPEDGDDAGEAASPTLEGGGADGSNEDGSDGQGQAGESDAPAE